MDKEPEPKNEDSKLAEKIPSESKTTQETWRWLEAIGDCV